MSVNGDYRKTFLWDLGPGPSDRRRKKMRTIEGALVLDIDGTLTSPGRKYQIYRGLFEGLCSFLSGGGSIIFNTGAILSRVERGTLVPLFSRLDEEMGIQEAISLFKQVCVMPENGSAVLLSKDVTVVENELNFSWYRIHELPLPNKAKIREIIENDLIPLQPGSTIAGDDPNDEISRDYILSWKHVSRPLELVKHIESEVKPRYPEIAWRKISLKAARTTIDFVNADSGKSPSIAWVLNEISAFSGRILGFGDLGDEFAEIIPTFNVNTEKPNEFRRRRMPSLELSSNWELLNKQEYVVMGSGEKAKVQCAVTGKEIKVLRSDTGRILYAEESSKGYLVPTTGKKGKPVKITPVTYRNGQDFCEVLGAGPGIAWLLGRLIDKGYFNKRN